MQFHINCVHIMMNLQKVNLLITITDISIIFIIFIIIIISCYYYILFMLIILYYIGLLYHLPLHSGVASQFSH